MWLNLLCVGCGGFIGAVLRVLTGVVISKSTLVLSFPLTTLCVNIVGSFVIGILLTLPSLQANPNLKSFLTAGLLGGLTTFSTFSFDTLTLIEQRLIVTDFINIALNVGVALFACFLGTLVAKALS